MSAIKGIHHVSLRVTPELYDKTVSFYRDTLGLVPYRVFDGSAMLAAGDSVIEIFSDAESVSPRAGALEHFAFFTDTPDELLEKIRSEGYNVVTGPAEITLKTMDGDGYTVGFAFFEGPAGELIELFCEK